MLLLLLWRSPRLAQPPGTKAETCRVYVDFARSTAFVCFVSCLCQLTNTFRRLKSGLLMQKAPGTTAETWNAGCSSTHVCFGKRSQLEFEFKIQQAMQWLMHSLQEPRQIPAGCKSSSMHMCKTSGFTNTSCQLGSTPDVDSCYNLWQTRMTSAASQANSTHLAHKLC
jgi:hypothetical protein